MCLGICLDECYESVTRVVHNSTNADFASVLAVLMVVFQHADGLFLAFAGMFHTTSMEVTVIAIVPADRADSILLG